MLERIVTRKANCGHWIVMAVLKITDDMEYAQEIYHFKTFDDFLMVLNGQAIATYV